MGIVPVGHKTLQTANGYRLTLDATDTLALALSLLGAYPAANSRQGAGTVDDLIGALVILLTDFSDKTRDIDGYGTLSHTGFIFTIQAAGSFIQSLLFGIAEGHLIEVMVADLGVLHRHFVFL